MDELIIRKKKRTRRVLLIVGMILSLLWTLVGAFGFIASIVVVFFSAIFASLIVAIISGIFGGGGSSSSAASQTANEMLNKYGWTMPTTFAIALIAFIGFVLAIVALVLFNTAKAKKKGKTAGILAIISGATLFFIPVELIGGILTLKLTDEEFAYRSPKKKKEKLTVKSEETKG